ncbi:InlB B-repeat-containing protein [Vescimonas sanitatis]|uniref:InlB B-repeat-containing protein n=1 Tax=Vescimonas sanitatis TaxID=3376993 RepID=UPI003B7866B8
MKKRILSILLLCCMVLTLLPTAAFAAGELPDVKLSVPTTFDKTVDLTGQNKELKITDSKTYLIKGSADPNWYFQYRIKIDGKGKNITPHIFLDGVRLQAPKDGPAIELYGGASACLYFIGGDSELIGAENFAALQKNKTDGYLRVLVQTGTKLTCEGGRYGAGIGGSKVGIKNFSQGHGMNLHFGSLATGIYGGEILATSGVYGAGIGGGQGGVGEQIYVYSGKLTVRSVSEGAGIGGGQGGPGRFIYIKGGTVNAGSESGGAGIGSGDQDGQNKSEDAHHIEISGGTVEAWSNYAGAGIGGGRGGSGYDISITGGVVRAQGYLGAGIGGGMNGNSGNILIKDTTLTALAFPLYQDYGYTELSASAVGRGSNRAYYMAVMQDQEFAMIIEENIKIGASDGKSVWLSATGWQWRHNQEPYKKYWGTTTELLIPNENGRVDLQRLSLPYAYNYGRVISKLELRCEESTCSHELGWTDRDGCHIWACVKCGARDPAAEMSKQNAKHIPGDWSKQKQLCTVCGYVMGTDTKAPVLEGLKNGESYTIEDVIDGNPGAYTFTVSDPAESGETSSGIKSVTINGEPQAGPTYRLPAPDGGNNDAGNEYTVVATDNAGNETTATVRTYRRHHVKVISQDGKKTYADLMLPHNEYLVLQIRLPAGVSATLTDQADGTEIPYDKENGEFRAGLITKSRTLVLNYSTEYPRVELRLGTGQYFTGYNADSDEPYYLKGASMDENSYQIGMWVDTDAKPGYYLSSPERYTQEELAALDGSLWKEYKIAEATPGSIVLPFILITIDAAAYEENGGWYVYAKATNPTGTTYVSTPKMIIDVENPKAIDFSTGKELVSNGKYWGDLRFTVEDSSPVTVRHYTSPGGTAELLTPDEKGVYTISAEYDGSTQHMLVIEDACGNTTSYKSFKVCWNYLINVREKDHWDAPPAQPIRISKGQNLQEALSNINIGVFAADTNDWIPVDVSWKIPDDYDPQSRREQTFTVLGTVVLEGTGARCPSGLDVVPRPGEEWKKNISVQVTVEGEPQYKVTVQDCKNGRVKVVNAAGTAEDGTPLFCKDELVMLSIAPDEGYMLSTLSVNGIPATVAAGEDTYTFVQPEGDVTITAAFEKRNEHTVTFEAGGGSEPEELPDEVPTAMPAKKVLHGSEYSLPECEFVAPEGKQFKAWEIGGTEYPVNAPVTVTADITVKALWEDAPPAHEHSYGDWSKDGTSHWHECTDDDCPKKPESIKDKAAHVYTDDADTTCNVCDYDRSVTPPAPTEFIVTFDAGDGTSSVGSMTTTNQKLSSLPSASRSKHSFNGWYTEKNGGTKVTTDTVFHAKTTVYAHWTYTGGGYYYPPVTYYTLRFETGGGSDISSVQGTYNAYIDLTQYVPTWRGHTFTGWYSERSLKNKVSGVYLAKDMTVYAGWRVTTVPQTGDSSVLGLWGFSLCTSLAGFLALTTWQIRRRRQEKSLQIIEK